MAWAVHSVRPSGDAGWSIPLFCANRAQKSGFGTLTCAAGEPLTSAKNAAVVRPMREDVMCISPNASIVAAIHGAGNSPIAFMVSPMKAHE
ncbi:hypothetical protein [Sphingomonas sp.]|uniref:hypothetical protein n=1 Tax=Sphingomonas sp. TaxID=28214 RepID=UPI0031DBDF01